MRCYAPISRVDKYNSTKNNLKKHIVPCGQCVACMINVAEDYALRLEQEQRDSFNAFFCTFTYAEDELPEDCELDKNDFQLFMKRLRQNFIYAGYGKQNIKYFTVAEYGEEFGRPHFHSIMFNMPCKGSPLSVILHTSWQKGLVDIRDVNEGRIRYVTGYMVKRGHIQEEFGRKTEPFRLVSNGIGESYIKKRKKWHNDDISRLYMVKDGGKKSRLPRYYRERIYSKEDRKFQSDTFQVVLDDTEDEIFNKYVKKSDKNYKKHIKELRSKYEADKYHRQERFRSKLESNKSKEKNYEHF
jgi:hypothetical protein